MVADEEIDSLNLAEALSVLQKLKGVSPALARLVQDAVGSEIQGRTPANGSGGKDKEWTDLSVEEQAAAGTLGYNREGWEAGDEPIVCTILWTQLAAAVRSAAVILGYAQSSWDYELETMPEEPTLPLVFEAADLPPAAPAAPPPPAAPQHHVASAFPAPPAPPEQDFDLGENVVAGKDKHWPDLTNAERISATNLGFDQPMWDAGDAPEACATPFAQLNTTFKVSAQALGYTQATWDAELPEEPADEMLPPRPRTPPRPQEYAQLQPQASAGNFPPLAPAAHDFPALQPRPQMASRPAPQPSPAQAASEGEWETVSSVPRGRGGGGTVARSGLGASVGAASTRAGDGAILSAASVENSRFSGGYIFGCKPETYSENMSRQLFGVTKQHLRDIQAIAPSSVLFLFNYSTKVGRAAAATNPQP